MGFRIELDTDILGLTGYDCETDALLTELVEREVELWVEDREDQGLPTPSSGWVDYDADYAPMRAVVWPVVGDVLTGLLHENARHDDWRAVRVVVEGASWEDCRAYLCGDVLTDKWRCFSRYADSDCADFTMWVLSKCGLNTADGWVGESLWHAVYGRAMELPCVYELPGQYVMFPELVG